MAEETKVLKLCEKCKKHNHNITYAMCYYCKQEAQEVQEAFSKAEGKENIHPATFGMVFNKSVDVTLHLMDKSSEDFRTLLNNSFNVLWEVMCEQKEKRKGNN